ncbi:type IV pilus assembly protein PilA [Streptohalobacillus salinus]|uniref:Type IV pilus assembly protein PilA n=1 Tax=Streptohalobacillus salinus TaxID=621096 RepID=A0A2V3W7C8_9BACI|nr:prepilin-type N-terminal cleavage/methylation domain-containing protein [Streptohalobacillus salinus]PXW90032.1 type IV pilus assembly protein PilA [Streptohalobacillus salinus]
MVNKLRKMLKNEKGFTLVELLAVIVILGIIVAIAIPAIGNIIDTAEDDATAAEEQLVVDAARLYDIQEGIDSDVTTVQDVIDEGYLQERASGEADISVDTDRTFNKDENGVITLND